MRIVCDNSKKLGRGAFAIVFNGTFDTTLVAVKRLQLEDLDVESSKRGEEALLHLDHPNVIKLLFIENDSNFRYYALELCKASLDQIYLKDGKEYCGPVPQLDDMLLQLASGLKYIHEKKLVHRDIKPENVLIWVGDGHNVSTSNTETEILMKWADFGLCKPTNERGSFSMSGVKGTFNWLAPEILAIQNETSNSLQMRGSNKSDVFAEGLIFGYILLKGQHIFGDNTTIVSNTSTNNPVNLTKIPEEHLQLVEEVIKKQLKPNPEERITSDEVFANLQIKIGRNQEQIPSTFPVLNINEDGMKEIRSKMSEFACEDYASDIISPNPGIGYHILASGPSLPNSAKARIELQPKKAAEKVGIGNLPESELDALLDEVLQYSGERDGEKGSELFQSLLRETQKSGEESPTAFRPIQNTSNPSAVQQRRRRSRKKTSVVPFSSASPDSTTTTTTTTNQEDLRSSTTTMNGSSVDDGIPFQRRIHRPTGVVGDARMDDNGNPFLTVNGTTIQNFLQRTSPPATNTINIAPTPTVYGGGSGLPTAIGLMVKRKKNKKKGENVLLSNDLPGFVGNRNVDELLEYIESSESNGKKAADNKAGPKHNGTLAKETSSKMKPNDKKSSSNPFP